MVCLDSFLWEIPPFSMIEHYSINIESYSTRLFIMILKFQVVRTSEENCLGSAPWCYTTFWLRPLSFYEEWYNIWRFINQSVIQDSKWQPLDEMVPAIEEKSVSWEYMRKFLCIPQIKACSKVNQSIKMDLYCNFIQRRKWS